MKHNLIKNDKKINKNTVITSIAAIVFMLCIIGAWALIMAAFSGKENGIAFEDSQEFTDYLENGIWHKTDTREYPIQAAMIDDIDITSQSNIEIDFQNGEVERKEEDLKASQQEDGELYYRDNYQIDSERMAAVSYLNTFCRTGISFSDGKSPQCMALELDYYYEVDESGLLIERLALYDNLIDEYYFVTEANIYEKSN